eukprot:10058406-Alexandrium_andersonii.AAC.1
MSASLVGSEMCIRDRIRDLREKWRRTRKQGCSPVRPSCLAVPAGLSVGDPVSYTHLTLPTICSV